MPKETKRYRISRVLHQSIIVESETEITRHDAYTWDDRLDKDIGLAEYEVEDTVEPTD